MINAVIKATVNGAMISTAIDRIKALIPVTGVHDKGNKLTITAKVSDYNAAEMLKDTINGMPLITVATLQSPKS